MSEMRERLLEEFRDPDYRHVYCSEFLNTFIATQIKVLRESHDLSQSDLAEMIGTSQPAISAHENPDKASWSLSTLKKFARAFDLALVVKFESFGNVLKEINDFNRENLVRPSFDMDPEFQKSPPAEPQGRQAEATSGFYYVYEFTPEQGKFTKLAMPAAAPARITSIGESGALATSETIGGRYVEAGYRRRRVHSDYRRQESV